MCVCVCVCTLVLCFLARWCLSVLMSSIRSPSSSSSSSLSSAFSRKLNVSRTSPGLLTHQRTGVTNVQPDSPSPCVCVCVCVCMRMRVCARVPLALLAALRPVDQVLQVLVLHRSVLLGARQAEQRTNPLSPNVQDGVCVSHFLQVPEQTHGEHIQTSPTCYLFYNVLNLTLSSSVEPTDQNFKM